MTTRIAVDAEPIPGYRLVERLGRGGFGEVWKALAPGGIYKAIKFVYGDLDEATEGGKPAQQELKALNRVKSIRHPYILSLERYDIIDGQLLIVMELADRNLFDRFRECQKQGLIGIPRDELLGYMEETAEALDLMNAQFQLQHLDIKPQNLFLVFNHVKVADFGLAKDLEGMQATLTGGVTPVYAAPETFECRVTRFCDQYSLAIVFEELLTGQRPFNGTTARHLMMQHIQSPPDLTSLPECDHAIVGRALAKKPDERFPTCAAFVQALKDAERAAASALIERVKTSAPATPAENGNASTPAIPIGNGNPAAPIIANENGNAAFPTVVVAVEPKQGIHTPPMRTGSLSRDRSSLSPLGARAATSMTTSRNGTSKLPALIVPKASASSALANARPAPPERTGDGILFPALVIGLGQYGLTVLQRLRRTVRDRYGNSTPHLRFLYLDTEGETLQSLNAQSNSIDANEVYLARLNRPSHYSRTRDDLPDVSNWLNPQLLFRIPRQPITSGVRAFGRLALCDHYRAIMAKVRADLEAVGSNKAIDEAVSKTGLKLRSNVPRVYIISSVMGGSGGGMFLDLAYAVRLQLRLLGYKQPEVHGLLFVPEIDRNTPKSQAVANTYAALTELLHFNSSATTYETVFDTNEGPIIDRDPPFKRCTLMQLPASTQPSTVRPMVGLGTGFLYYEMFTPLGKAAEKARVESAHRRGSSTALQSSGTFRLTWPRRVLIERAARRCCERLLTSWTASGGEYLVEPVRVWLDEQWVSRQLAPELVRARLAQKCPRFAGGDWTVAIQSVLSQYEPALATQGMESADLCTAMERVGAIVGTPDLEGRSRNSGEVGNDLEQAGRALAAEAESALIEMTNELIELPGSRLLGAEEFLRQLTAKAQSEMSAREQLVNRLNQEVRDLYVKYVTQASSIESMSRGNRRAAASREVMTLLQEFSAKRLDLLECGALVQFYRAMLAGMPDRQRDVQGCRKRLESILQRIKEKKPSSDRHGFHGPDKALLPPGCDSLDAAAAQLADCLGPDQMLELDTGFQARLGQTNKGLLACCLDRSESSRHLFGALFDQAQEFLAPYLVKSSAATIFFQRTDQAAELSAEITEAFEQAAPTLTTDANPEDGICVLATPSGDDGEKFVSLAREVLPDVPFATTTDADDIVFYREQQNLNAADIPQLGPAAREAFNHFTDADQAAPFTRIDVRWQTAERENS